MKLLVTDCFLRVLWVFFPVHDETTGDQLGPRLGGWEYLREVWGGLGSWRTIAGLVTRNPKEKGNKME